MDGLFPYYPYGGINIFKDCLGISFALNHTTNTGAAWGMFADFQKEILIIRIICIIGLLLYLRYAQVERKHILPLILVITGAIGNVLDVFIYGHVIDMFHFIFWGYHFPVFNVADSAICSGMLLLIINNFNTATHLNSHSS
jgi:signal peptidase II